MTKKCQRKPPAACTDRIRLLYIHLVHAIVTTHAQGSRKPMFPCALRRVLNLSKITYLRLFFPALGLRRKRDPFLGSHVGDLHPWLQPRQAAVRFLERNPGRVFGSPPCLPKRGGKKSARHGKDADLSKGKFGSLGCTRN